MVSSSRSRSLPAVEKDAEGASSTSFSCPTFAQSDSRTPLQPWQASDKLRNERAAKIRGILAPPVTQPQTAKEMADALAHLVFAHDIRHLQRELVRVQDNVKG